MRRLLFPNSFYDKIQENKPKRRENINMVMESNENNEEAPSDANEVCVGPNSAEAGKAASCAGCPNASTCASNQNKTNTNTTTSALSESATHTILVLSGKGGVGKSTIATQLAFTLSSRGYNVGLLDVDICGPSAPRMLGVLGRHVHQSGSGWCPVYVNPNLAVMSISFLLPDEDSAVVWRGPRKNGLIKQFLMDTDWGGGGENEDDGQKMDYVIVDTPPGTSDEHISTVQMLQGGEGRLSGAVVVTTPEEVSMADVRKELNFCKKTKVPVIGVLENMSELRMNVKDVKFYKKESGNSNVDSMQSSQSLDYTDYVMDLLRQKCPEILDMEISTNVFPPSGTGPKGMADKFEVPFLGSIPLDPNLLKSCENGVCFVDAYEENGSSAVGPMNDLVDALITALPVEDDEEEIEDMDENMT